MFECCNSSYNLSKQNKITIIGKNTHTHTHIVPVSLDLLPSVKTFIYLAFFITRNKSVYPRCHHMPNRAYLISSSQFFIICIIAKAYMIYVILDLFNPIGWLFSVTKWKSKKVWNKVRMSTGLWKGSGHLSSSPWQCLASSFLTAFKAYSILTASWHLYIMCHSGTKKSWLPQCLLGTNSK